MRKENIIVGSLWQHFKGKTVEVLMLAKDSEDLEFVVIYKHDGDVWARKISSFLSDEDVSKRPDNVTGQKYRFEIIERNDQNDKY